MSTKISFPLYGMFTIAEMVKAIEGISKVTVTRADCENDIVTLTCEPIPDDSENFIPHTDFNLCDDDEGLLSIEDAYLDSECYECGTITDYHEQWCPHNHA